jgi:hypothetical protein
MTLLAIKNGIFAADAGIFCDNMMRGTRRKIVRLPDGSLFGASGAVSVIIKVEEWLASDCVVPPPDQVAEETFGGLMLKPDGSVWKVDHLMNIYPDFAEFHVEGSHCEFLLGVMATGGSAEKAVRLGCKHCMWAAGPVQVERIN